MEAAEHEDESGWQQSSAGLFLTGRKWQQTVTALLFQSRPTAAVPLTHTRGCRDEEFNFNFVFERGQKRAERRIGEKKNNHQSRRKASCFSSLQCVFSFLPPYFSGVLGTSVCDTGVTRLLFSILSLLQTQLPTQRTIKNP